jgi:hypothetical protein
MATGIHKGSGVSAMTDRATGLVSRPSVNGMACLVRLESIGPPPKDCYFCHADVLHPHLFVACRAEPLPHEIMT